MQRKRLVFLGSLTLAAISLATCRGQADKVGPEGPPGATPEGASISAEYVWCATCRECHYTIYNKFILSDHIELFPNLAEDLNPGRFRMSTQ